MSSTGERRWAGDDLDRAATRRGLERDGETLRLRRGITIRDEVGRTNTRHVERITSTRWARKMLVVDRLGSQAPGAVLCPYLTGPAEGAVLAIDVNGQTIEHTWDRGDGYWFSNWRQIEIPATALKEGENSVTFRAVDEGTWTLLMESSLWPNRSAVSDDSGQTWRWEEIGDNDRDDGEYVVRLWLDQHETTGFLESSPVDLLATAAGSAIAPEGAVSAVDVTLDAQTPDVTRTAIEWRQGSTPAYDPSTWSAWAPLDTADTTGARYGQWRLLLSTDDPSVTPVIQGVTLKVCADLDAAPVWRLTEDTDNEPLLRSSFRFAHMRATDSRGQMLRERWNLDRVVGPAKSEFEALLLLREWVRFQWEDGWNMGPLDYCPPWDAPVILELASQQLALGMCTHYATVFTQCAAALGFYARTQVMRSHCITEVWSNDYGKWVTMDPGGDSNDATKHTYHWERDGVPLSAREAHLAWVNDDYGDVVMSPAPAPETKDRFTVENRLQLWSRFMISMRNDETTTLEPGEPEHGKGSYHYDGYLFWQDDRTPPLKHFSRHTDREGDLYWDLQRVHLHLQATGNGLRVDMDTETPNLARLEVRIDGGAWEERPASFVMPLKDVENRIEARAVNAQGRAGAVSHVTVVA